MASKSDKNGTILEQWLSSVGLKNSYVIFYGENKYGLTDRNLLKYFDDFSKIARK